MVCLEWWAFEAFMFLAGILGTAPLGAQGVIMNVDVIIFAVRTICTSDVMKKEIQSH